MREESTAHFGNSTATAGNPASFQEQAHINGCGIKGVVLRMHVVRTVKLLGSVMKRMGEGVCEAKVCAAGVRGLDVSRAEEPASLPVLNYVSSK
eukprot:1142961-Pelagomonas_calceolata.AAC.2